MMRDVVNRIARLAGDYYLMIDQLLKHALQGRVAAREHLLNALFFQCRVARRLGRAGVLEPREYLQYFGMPRGDAFQHGKSR